MRSMRSSKISKGLRNPYNRWGKGIGRKKKHAKFKGDVAKSTFRKRYNPAKFKKFMSKY